jgi:hypothetical protein
MRQLSSAPALRPLRLGTAALLLVGGGAASLVAAPPAAAAGPVPVQVAIRPNGSGALTGPNGAVFAKLGGPLLLTATTDPAATCLAVTDAAGSPVVPVQSSPAGRSSWTVGFTAGSGDGVQVLTVRSGTGVSGTTCSEAGGALNTPGTVSYVLDNTGPVVAITTDRPPNAAGWFNAPATFTLIGTDAGVGIAPGAERLDVPVSQEQQAGIVSGSIRDLLRNTGSAATFYSLDTTPPTLTGSRLPLPNAAGWNATPVTVAFSCADNLSGITGTCPRPVTLSGEGAAQSVTRSVGDVAGNSTSSTVSGINIDLTRPTLTGVPVQEPNAAGWYRDDVTVRWPAADALSGVAAPVPDGTIGGEGTGLVTTASVTDRAGNTTGATSQPVRIDRTAPTTAVVVPADWVTTDQTLTFDAADNLSGVQSTTAQVDDGTPQQGSSLRVTGDGDHVITYWSTDRAGNAEAPRTAHVKIDGSAPTIRHDLDPAPNPAGWHRGPVTVTFTCADGVSGIRSCTAPVRVSDEGAGQQVTGSAVDQAGNSTPDTATVNLDRTDPVVTGAPDRQPNVLGWYRAPVTVAFTCSDALSGIAAGTGCPDPVTVGQGRAGSASGSTADAAGNTASATVGGLDVDTTDPVLTGAPRPAAGDSGWWSGDVTVDWTCSDALSGVGPDACPAPSVLTGEGADLAATGTVADQAGNQVTRAVTGIRIDRTPPQTRASAPETATGWYTGDTEVTLTAQDGLSGVGSTRYALDGADPKPYTAPVLVSGTGDHTLVWWSVDVAGNVEPHDVGHSLTVRIDDRRPRITGSTTPAPNANGWWNGPVAVGFDCTDDESGIAACDAGTTLSDEGRGQSVTGAAMDLAGNGATATVDGVDIDRTPPTLTGTPTTDPNAAGWYSGDVTVGWAASDGLSGVDPDAAPAPSVVTGEGTGLRTGTVEVRDLAGNAAQAWLGGLDIDRTPPLVSGAPTTAPNPAGWYSGEVTVAFICSDPLSGVATCPTEKVLTGNGKDRSVTGDPAKDLAGNATAGVTVGRIDIDGLPPVTTSATLCDAATCSGGVVPVAITATDQPGLSGVAALHWTVNGGPEQVADGATAQVDVPLVAGAARLSYWAVDRAGNAEPVNSVTLDGDQIAPSVTHSQVPAPNAEGWNRSDVTVTFSATDEDNGSGVDPASVTPPVTVTDETAVGGRTIVGSAKDLAGNRGTDSVLVRLDRTAPSVDPVVTPAAGASGWRTGPVTVHFACRDALSGVAVCPDDVVLTGNGAGADGTGQSVTRTGTDMAGNSRSATASGIRIDREPPTVTSVGVRNGGLYTLGAVPPPVCTGRDDVSGMASCLVALDGPAGGGVGSYGFTAVATDRAGNSTTVRGSYRVVYRFDGFSQPINDLRWFGGSIGFAVFRAGTTVPVRVQLKAADGSVVQGGAPTFGPPVRAWLALLPVNSPPGVGGTAAAPFRWNAGTRTWEHLWDTRGLTPGYLYRIGATLDDGRTYYAYIGLG